MQIAVIGAGKVGSVLGRRLAEAGHSVVYGLRNPSKYPDLAGFPVQEAVNSAEVIILATPWTATEEVLRSIEEFDKKVLIDATNPIAPDFSGVLPGPSAGVQVASWAPTARVVKAFNTVGAPIMENPAFPAGPATLLIAGEDAEAKTIVKQLSVDLGFEPIDVGGIDMAQYTEALAWIWITLAVKKGYGPGFEFRLHRRTNT